MLAFALIISITQCNPKPNDNPTVASNKKTSCDSCTINNKYCEEDKPGDYYSADIAIDKFEVSQDLT